MGLSDRVKSVFGLKAVTPARETGTVKWYKANKRMLGWETPEDIMGWQRMMATDANYRMTPEQEKNRQDFQLTCWKKALDEHTSGYGFIRRDNGEDDVIVLGSAIKTAGFGGVLEEGVRLSYCVETEKGKTSAVDLKLV